MASTQVPPASPLPPIQSISSSFQMNEYLALLIKQDPSNTKLLVELPTGDNETDKDSSPIKTTSRKKESDLWVYEHLRRLPQDLTPLVTSLLPVCSREKKTCSLMKAGEWEFVCAAHDSISSSREPCSAIDYILHSLDQHTALFTSGQAFPSRLAISSASERFLGQQARRVSRVFAHAWFHHREVFEVCEAETHLYARFVALVTKYHLLGPDGLVIPLNKSGPGQSSSAASSSASPTIEKRATGSETPERKRQNTQRRIEPRRTGRVQAGSSSSEEDDTFRRDKGVRPSTAVRKGSATNDFMNRRGVDSGARKLFPVEIPQERDELDDREDELMSERGKPTNIKGDLISLSVLSEEPGILGGEPNGDSSESDSSEEELSDPELAVNPGPIGNAEVDSDEEDGMVEDVGAKDASPEKGSKS